MIPRSQNVLSGRYSRGEGFGESRKSGTCFSPSQSNLGLVSSRFARFVRNREIYNPGMASGPVLFKIKGKVGFSYFWGSKKQKQRKTNENNRGNLLNVGFRSSK